VLLPAEAFMMMRLIVRLLINAAALAAAAWAVPGIHYEGWGALALTALIFGIVNALIRPIVMVLSCPLLIVTLGLFTFVVNVCILLRSAPSRRCSASPSSSTASPPPSWAPSSSAS
jgi:uncharacterized membrane protein YvlD (DUF360 family)